MKITYYILAGVLMVAHLLPFINHQHWVFRVSDFGRVQLFILQFVLFCAGFLLVEETNPLFLSLQLLLMGFIIQNALVLVKYTPLYRDRSRNLKNVPKHSDSISILSVNVYQFNTQYQRLIDLIHRRKPNIILTMESNQDWENALSVLDKDYPHYKKIGLENTYGMHFYTNFAIRDIHVHHFVADDLPSIEARLTTHDGVDFVFFGVHPPPPSPTEEETSKERDGELLSVAKRARKIEEPVVVVGDFNNVAWAKSSILFRKTSELIDPRIGHGFVSTFHADYKLLRFPIDLLFHSTDVFIEEFKALEHIGSDHLPLYCQFFINSRSDKQEEDIEKLEDGEMKEVNEMIEEGKEEQSDRETVVKE